MATKKKWPRAVCRGNDMKKPITVSGGPMHGETLWLTGISYATGVFTYRGQTGRYVGSVWEAVK